MANQLYVSKPTIAIFTLLTASALSLPIAPAEPGQCPIPGPEDFSVEEMGNANFLHWAPPMLAEAWGITAYRIYRTTQENAPPSAYEFLIQVSADLNHYIDDQIEPMRHYEYMVTAVGFCGEGLPSFAPGQPTYPYCPPLQPQWDPNKPGGIDPQVKLECLMAPPGDS